MILSTLFRRYRAWKRRELERRELIQLTDRELADIGISRLDIDRVVSQETAELPIGGSPCAPHSSCCCSAASLPLR